MVTYIIKYGAFLCVFGVVEVEWCGVCVVVWC